MKRLNLILLFCSLCCFVQGREYHVSVKGNDNNAGTVEAPFKTINRAVYYAFPGDIITVHAGTYREWVNPLRGGTSDDNRIVYRAAPGEKVEIKGSEVITGWTKTKGGVWKVVIPNAFFGDYNPYKELLGGDWFNDHGRIHHIGEVFLNGKSLYEKLSPEEILNPVPDKGILDPDGSTYVWRCEVDDHNTTIWANFHGYNPNKEQVEITTRHTCFYPLQQGIDYLTISGFEFSQAATQWGAPTAEQIGMVATHWNKGWIIENNIIHDSKCAGITLGKERSSGHNSWLADLSIDGALHYIEVTFNAVRCGWNKENIGSHLVRNNTIYNCEQAGICGSMGAAFSVIEHNHIYNIYVKGQYDGAEIGGIKFHGAIDTQIRNNRIHNTWRSVWLDWMTQGTRISQNLFYDNVGEDIFLEVNHGPYIIDNNIFGSYVGVLDISQGGAYVHNLLIGRLLVANERGRYTPYFLPHSTEVAGLSIIPGGDNRYYNNLFLNGKHKKTEENYRYGLSEYNNAAYPMFVSGNAYYMHNKPYDKEENNIVRKDFDPDAVIEDEGDRVYLSFSIAGLDDFQIQAITTELLGKAKLPKQAYEQPDGTPIVFDRDYFDHKRTGSLVPGPFSEIKEGRQRIRIW
ncbi:right-handed parallel beta-helix repeat-containing protein [uncultured Bacteroides sp.]|uniref:right-handed parallel beta-helix repeat-containing protein n=1 Tax=uncultured Bacteroides sp. TaxID=162156 RepID=UPI0025F6F0DE|nr:right-handed parallel beta-helix repeat-containing protein [uncultured Bacteroides sp.]